MSRARSGPGLRLGRGKGRLVAACRVDQLDALDADVLAVVAVAHERADMWVTTEARTGDGRERKPDSFNHSQLEQGGLSHARDCRGQRMSGG